MNYSWEVLNLSTENRVDQNGELLENAVVHVKWRKTGTDDLGRKASFLGRTQLDLTADSVTSESFIDFANLTKDVVVSWIESNANQDEVNAAIQRRINKDNVEVNRTPPWPSV